MPDMRSASNVRLKVPGPIALQSHMDKSRTHVNFEGVSELVVLLFLGMTYSDRFIKAIYLAGRKVVPYIFPPVRLLIIQKEGMRPRWTSQIPAKKLQRFGTVGDALLV